MPRLIDADELRKDVLNLPDCPNGFSDTYDKAFVLVLVDEAPTIDAVPVIRCKGCKHWQCDDEETYCDELGIFNTDMNSYCSYAKRKES